MLGLGLGLGLLVRSAPGSAVDTANHILAENSSIITAENGDHLITET